MKLKMISGCINSEVEEKVNEFVNKEDIKVIDILQSSCWNKNLSCSETTVTVIYDDYECKLKKDMEEFIEELKKSRDKVTSPTEARKHLRTWNRMLDELFKELF